VSEDSVHELRRLRELHRKMEMDLDVLKERLEVLEQKIEESPVPVAAFVAPPLPRAFPESRPLKPEGLPVKPKVPSVPRSEVAPPQEVPKVPPTTPPPIPMDRVEMQLGRVWLVRAGIVTLLTGLVFLGNMTYQAWIAPLGAPGKLALLFLSAFLLAGVGFWLKRGHEGLKYLGHGLMAGGAALFYYSTYASHFVPALRVVESPLLAAIFLLIVAVGFLGLAGKMGFQSAAIPTILLSYYVASINPQGGAALFSNLLLAAMAVTLVCWKGWLTLSFASLSGAYLSFLHWRWVHGGGSLTIEAAFLISYWVLFTLLVFLARGDFQKGVRATFLTLNNGAFFAIGSWAMVTHFPAQYWLFPLGLGAVLVVLALICARVRPRDELFDGAFLSQGLLLLGVGLATKLSGYQFSITAAVMAGFYLYASTLWQRRVFLVFSLLSAAAGTLMALPDAGTLGKVWPVVVLLLGCLVGRKFMSQGWRSLSVDLLGLAYGLAGIFLLGVSLWLNVSLDRAVPVFALCALGACWLVRFHRLPELSLVLQGWLGVALVGWFFVAQPAWWLTLLLLIVFLAVFHWWTGSQASMFPVALSRLFAAVWVVATTILLQGWLMRVGTSEELWVMPGLGCLMLAYGLWEKTRFFAWASLWFGTLSTILLGEAVLEGQGPINREIWALLLLGLYVVLLVVAQYRAGPFAKAFGVLRRIFTLAVGLLFIALAVFRLVDGWSPVALLLVAVGAFAVAGWRRKPEALLYGTGFFFVVLGALIFAAGDMRLLTSWLFLGEVLALYGALFFARSRFLASPQLPQKAFTTAMGFAVLLFWWQASRLATLHGQAEALTLVWCVTAFLILAVGFLFRDRTTRLMGMGIFVACLVRVYCVDVWQVDKALRYVSFVVLGVVLLAFGWLYGRFADWLKKFL